MTESIKHVDGLPDELWGDSEFILTLITYGVANVSEVANPSDKNESLVAVHHSYKPKLIQVEAELAIAEAERAHLLEVVARLAEILARITGEWTDKQIERMRSSDISPHPDYIEVARRLAGLPKLKGNIS